ncbi:retrotransposon protein, putative, ty1-copia subclass, partial [Tanacetum coccineum]
RHGSIYDESYTTLPLSFWDYALESATHILNMVPTKKVYKTPYELWYGKAPNLSYLKVWGCEALVKRDTPDKLQQRSVKSQWESIDLEEIQDEDTSPSEITSEIPIEVEGFEPPQEEVIDVSLCLEVGSIRRIQVLDTAYWGFLGVGTTLDIFQNIILIPYFEYGVLSLSGYGVLSFIPLWSLVSAGTDTPYLP